MRTLNEYVKKADWETNLTNQEQAELYALEKLLGKGCKEVTKEKIRLVLSRPSMLGAYDIYNNVVFENGEWSTTEDVKEIRKKLLVNWRWTLF